MSLRGLLVGSAALLLYGCASYPMSSCVAVQNPDELVLSGTVLEKERVEGPVVIGRPASVKVEGGVGAGGSEQLLMAFAFAAGGLAAGGDPVLVSSLAAQHVTDPAFHSGQTTPGYREAEVGEPCELEPQVLNEGAYRYRVSSGARQFDVHSAYSGLDVGQCVTVFVSRQGSDVQARIAPGSDCKT